jgi:hypothetical protein
MAVTWDDDSNIRSSEVRAVSDTALGDAKLRVRDRQCETKLPRCEKGLGVPFARRNSRLRRD